MKALVLKMVFAALVGLVVAGCPSSGDGGAGDGDGADGADAGGDADGINRPPGASLVMAVTATPDQVRPEDSVSYQIIVGNDGIVDLYQVKVVTTKLAQWHNFNEDTVNADCGGFCQNGVQITWSIGHFPVGASRVIPFAPRVYGSEVADNTALRLVASASSLVGVGASATRTVVVRYDPTMTLAVTANRSSVASGEDVQFTLDYSTGSGGTAESATLWTSIPPGMEFVSATEGGQVVGDRVEWSLGNLGRGATGTRQAVLRLSGTPSNGTLLMSEARISATYVADDTGARSAQSANAQAVVPVR